MWLMLALGDASSLAVASTSDGTTLMECGVGVSVLVVTVIALAALGSRGSSAIELGDSRLSSLTHQPKCAVSPIAGKNILYTLEE